MSLNRFPTLKQGLTLMLLLTGTVGCSTTPLAVDTTSTPTFDGLYEVTGTNADKAWARSGINLADYSKIRLQSAGIEYRPGGESGRLWSSRSRAEHFEVTDAQKERLARLVAEVFQDELGKSKNFELTTETGPDVLLVRGALLDVVSYVPPDTMGRGEVFLSEVGAATLVIELRDSITEAILVRAVDRRVAENRAAGFQRSNRTTNGAEVKRLARSWASALRERLDEFSGQSY